jgi:hypothetical protein
LPRGGGSLKSLTVNSLNQSVSPPERTSIGSLTALITFWIEAAR